MNEQLERAVVTVQRASPRYRSVIGEDKWSNPFFTLLTASDLEKQGGDCLSTALMLHSQHPAARIVRETCQTEEQGIQTHYFTTKLSGKGYNPVADRYGRALSIASMVDHFGYWSTLTPTESLRADYALRGPQLLERLLSSGGGVKTIESGLYSEEEKGSLRLALIDPVAALRYASGDNSATFEELCAEIEKTLENMQIEV